MKTLEGGGSWGTCRRHSLRDSGACRFAPYALPFRQDGTPVIHHVSDWWRAGVRGKTAAELVPLLVKHGARVDARDKVRWGATRVRRAHPRRRTGRRRLLTPGAAAPPSPLMWRSWAGRRCTGPPRRATWTPSGRWWPPARHSPPSARSEPTTSSFQQSTFKGGALRWPGSGFVLSCARAGLPATASLWVPSAGVQEHAAALRLAQARGGAAAAGPGAGRRGRRQRSRSQCGGAACWPGAPRASQRRGGCFICSSRRQGESGRSPRAACALRALRFAARPSQSRGGQGGGGPARRVPSIRRCCALCLAGGLCRCARPKAASRPASASNNQERRRAARRPPLPPARRRPRLHEASSQERRRAARRPALRQAASRQSPASQLALPAAPAPAVSGEKASRPGSRRGRRRTRARRPLRRRGWARGAWTTAWRRAIR